MLFVFASQAPSFSQELNDLQLKQQIINEIGSRIDHDLAESNRKILSSDSLILKLDAEINELRRNKDRIQNLTDRINAIENKQKAVNDRELGLYSGNYETAVINLAFLESDLKPINLFQSSSSFFAALNQTGNPMNYPEYEGWYEEFKVFINKEKDREVRIGVLNDMLSTTASFTKGTPLTGPVVGTLFDGIASFISSLGRSKRELREKSEKMMAVTMVLGQYSNDILAIENEWTSINESLKELQELYEETLNYNLGLIGESRTDFESGFITETNGNEKLEYLNRLKELARQRVMDEKGDSPKEWKKTFYYEMEKVQTLKIRFGEITRRVKHNITEYNDLIERYKKADFMASKIQELGQKLENLDKSFSDTYQPETYIRDAKFMYAIE